MADAPFVTIALPCLNEAAHIESVIRSVRPSGPMPFEMLVMDGGSDDGTQAIVERIARSDDRVRLVANERRLQAAGINKAAAIADPRSSVLVRIDCHAAYPPDFVAHLVDELRRTGAGSVVVPMEAEGEGCLQRGIAAAQNSRIGTGGSPHRSKGGSRFIDHGHHAAFDLADFRALGGYDESFSHNEDAEYDHRLGLSGRRIWLSAETPIAYFPRATLPGLARQYANHGRGRGRTMFKHAMRPKPRQLAPVAILVMVAASLLLALAFGPLLLLPAFAYAAACLVAGAVLAVRSRERCALLAGPAAMTMHLAWGVGFLQSAFASLRAGRTPARPPKLG